MIQVVSVKPSLIEYVPNQEGRFLSIKGRCDCEFPGLKDKVDSPFQLFLEQGEKVLGSKTSGKYFVREYENDQEIGGSFFKTRDEAWKYITIFEVVLAALHDC